MQLSPCSLFQNLRFRHTLCVQKFYKNVCTAMTWQLWHLVSEALRDIWGTGSSSKAQLSHVCPWMLTRWSECCLRTAWAFAKGHPAIDTVRRQKKEQNKSLFTAESSYELAHPPCFKSRGIERKEREWRGEGRHWKSEWKHQCHKESEWQVTFHMPSFVSFWFHVPQVVTWFGVESLPTWRSLVVSR